MLQTIPKPRIGVLAQGLAAYWPQFIGMREKLLGHYRTLLGKFGDEVTLVDAGLVDSIETAREANQLFRAHDVDVVFVHLATYANSEPLLITLAGISVPVVLLNVQSVVALDVSNAKEIGDWLGVAVGCAGLPEATAMLQRTGKRFDLITGYLAGDVVVDRKIGEWCRAATLRRQLRTKCFGLLGRPYAGMTDLYIDEIALFSRFGAYVRHLNWDDVARHRAAVTDAELERRLASLSDAFDVPDDVDAADVADAAGVLAALDRLIAENDLCALPNHYEGPVSLDHVGLLAGFQSGIQRFDA